jgi:tight adherence protein B
MLTRPDSVALVCAAASLACWPVARNAGTRLTEALPRSRPRATRRTLVRLSDRRLFFLVLVPIIPLLGLAGSLSLVLLAAAGWCQYRVRRRGKAEAANAVAMAEALRTTIAELRAGAPPARAAEVAAANSFGQAASVMHALARAARLGGEIAASSPPIPEQLAKAWFLSRRHGLPVAELFDAVRRDVIAGARFAARADAGMSGPRASAAVLAALPAFGLLLGEAMGARPWQVLSGTPAGQGLLVLGSALILAGVAWSSRLTSLPCSRVAAARPSARGTLRRIGFA